MTASDAQSDPLPAPGVTAADPSVNGWNAQWVDDLYRQWAQVPEAVPESWQRFFEGFELGTGSASDHTHCGDPK